MEKESAPPIPTIEMGVHISYIRRDIDSINKKLDNLAGLFVLATDFQEHLKADADHETRIRRAELELPSLIDSKTRTSKLESENQSRKEFQDTLTGKMWGIGIIAGFGVSIIMALINHFL